MALALRNTSPRRISIGLPSSTNLDSVQPTPNNTVNSQCSVETGQKSAAGRPAELVSDRVARGLGCWQPSAPGSKRRHHPPLRIVFKKKKQKKPTSFFTSRMILRCCYKQNCCNCARTSVQ